MKHVFTLINFFGRIADFYQGVKKVTGNKFVKLFMFGLFILLIAYYFS